MAHDGNEKTLGNLDSLPLLPVPSLAQTCKKYLESVRPHVTPSDFETTRKVVHQFERGVGSFLHQKLSEKSKKTRNWLQKWWLDSYLLYRGPLPFFNNMGGFGIVNEDELLRKGRQTYVAAHAIYGYLKAYEYLASQEFPVDRLHRKEQLDMSQYYNAFSSGRYPGLKRDTQVLGFLRDGQILMQRHIIVMVRNRVFLLEVLDESLHPLYPDEIENLLYKAKAIAEQKPYGPSVGALTTLPRPEWKELQDYLFALEEKNKDLVEAINKSIFLVALDDRAPSNSDEMAKAVMGNRCENLWCDKGLTLFIFRNGVVGTHGDHVHLEGVTVSNISLKVRNYVDKYLEKSGGIGRLRQLTEPVEYEFVIDDFIKEAIQKAEERHKISVDGVTVRDHCFRAFGRTFVKEHNIHPDSFFQMAMHLAYYRLHGSAAPTYESATTRKFYQARTETLRSCTVQSVNWTRAMEDPSVPIARKVALLKEACSTHESMMKEANEGQGIDRHLLALQLIAAEEGIETPLIFKDKAWKASGGDCNFVLSTSVGGLGYDHGGLAPMIQDGYGVFYTLDQESFEICVTSFATSKKTDASAFMNELHRALKDTRVLLLKQARM